MTLYNPAPKPPTPFSENEVSVSRFGLKENCQSSCGNPGCVSQRSARPQKTSSGLRWRTGMSCESSSDCLTKSLLRAELLFFFLEMKRALLLSIIKSTKGTSLFLHFHSSYFIVNECPVSVFHHIYLPVIFAVLSLVCLLMSSLSGRGRQARLGYPFHSLLTWEDLQWPHVWKKFGLLAVKQL